MKFKKEYNFSEKRKRLMPEASRKSKLTAEVMSPRKLHSANYHHNIQKSPE
jgi:hypothetical protein